MKIEMNYKKVTKSYLFGNYEKLLVGKLAIKIF